MHDLQWYCKDSPTWQARISSTSFLCHCGCPLCLCHLPYVYSCFSDFVWFIKDTHIPFCICCINLYTTLYSKCSHNPPHDVFFHSHNVTLSAQVKILLRTRNNQWIIFTLFTLPDDLHDDVVVVCLETVIFVATQRHITEGALVWCLHCPSLCCLAAILWALATQFGPALSLHQFVMADGGNGNRGFWHCSVVAHCMLSAGQSCTELFSDVIPGGWLLPR